MGKHYQAIHKHEESYSAAKQFLEIKLLIENIIGHAKSGNILRQKIAYITTDHLVEIILNKTLLEIRKKPYSLASGIEMNTKKFNQLEKSFHKKLNFFSRTMPKEAKQGIALNDVPVIEEDVADVLDILHIYRNDVYHNNQRNIRVFRVFLPLFVAYVMKVLIGFSRPDWATWDSSNKDVADYCDKDDFGPSPGSFNAHKAYRKLEGQLSIREPAMSRLKGILTQDLRDRFQELVKEVSALPKVQDASIQTEMHFNQQVLEEDFRMKLNDDSKYLELIKLRKKHLKKKDYIQSAKIGIKLDGCMKNLRASFKSDYSYRGLLSIQSETTQLDSVATTSVLLENYYAVDQKLLIYKDLVTEINIRIEQEIQLAIDMARGK